MDKPSKVAVPRPISSRMTTERSLACFRMTAVSPIPPHKLGRRPNVIVVAGQFCERGRDIENGKRVRGSAQIVAGDYSKRAQPLKNFELEPERAVAGIGDLGLDLAEFGGGEADLAGQGLAMDEGRVQWRRHQLVAVLRGDLQER